MKKSAKEVVWYATVAALVFVARMLDHVVTVWLPVNAAIVTLAVVFTCIFVRPSWKNALFTGAIFGIMSLLTSVMFPGAFTMYFINPLISVVPRIAVGAAAYAIYYLFDKIFGEKLKMLGVSIACIVGALVNTALVMSMIYLFRTGDQAMMSYMQIIGIVLTVNTLLEVILPPVITPFVTFGVKKGIKNLF